MNTFQFKYGLLGSELSLVENIRIELSKSNHIIEIKELDHEVKNNKIIIPGFFNAHTHVADIALRGISGEHSLAELVGPEGVKHTYLQSLPLKTLEKNITLALKEAQKYGTLGWSDFREGGIEGLKPYFSVPEEYIPFGRPSVSNLSVLPLYAHIGIRDVLAYDRWDLLQQYIKSNDKLSFIHVSEDIELRKEWIINYGKSDIKWILDQIDIDAMIHLTHAENDDLEVIKRNDIFVILCMSSNQFTQVGTPPVDKIFENNLRVGLGTDNAMFSTLSLWDEMKLYRNYDIPSIDLLKAASVNGAYACGLNWGVEENNSNMIVINLPSIHNTDIYDFLALTCDETFIDNIITPNPGIH